MRIERDAMAANSGARIKRHEAERLGRRRTDYFPGVDAESITELGHLVRHADVYCSKRVFPKLRRLGNASRRNLMNLIDDLVVKERRNLGRIMATAADNLRDVVRLILRIARIDSLGRKCEQKIFVERKSFFLEHGLQNFVCRSRISC